MKIQNIVLTTLVALSLNAAAVAQNILLMDGPPGGTIRTDDYPKGAGYGFYVPFELGTTINALGFWDEGGDGLQADHIVALYQYMGAGYDYVLIASVVVPAGTGADLIDGYRWVSLGQDIYLPDIGQNGNYYATLASQGGGDPWTDIFEAPVLNGAMGTFSGNTIINNDQVIGSEFVVLSTSGLPVWGGANMAYIAPVPEPASFGYLVMAACGGAVLLARRRHLHR